jgi:hypothetical protein
VIDLFAAAGLDLPPSGKGEARARKTTHRSPRVPLFAHKVVDDAIGRSGFAPDDALVEAAREYARKVRGVKAAKEKTFRPVFIDDVLIKILGYSRIDPDRPYTLADEHTLGTGSVDTALGHFEVATGVKTVVAPFELKGPDTKDLDRIMPGRGKTPVQQAWEYANDAPGAKWVLVSNCVEIRLYGYGRGREAYEVFDVSRIDEPDELRRLWEILSARNFLGEATERLLHETDAAYADITDRLYQDYNDLRERLIGFLVNSSDGPKLGLGAAIEPAQKILDRILFIAFAQRRELMRGDLLETALKSHNEFNPQPVWQNFLGLFRHVDKGNFDMDIPPYNGGLFAHDQLVDSLILPEALAKDIAGLGNWDYRREVPVTVLGHIFEQSITDIERKRAEARGEAPPAVAKRKREGVVYTPDMVTRFLVEKTVGRTLIERRGALQAEHGFGVGDMAPKKEIAFWRAWLEILRGLTIVDPACGSGAFLVAAFDRLAQEYRPVLTRLEELGAPAEIDAFDEIVTKNLHGVDLNSESVEITRLSLWLKTARRDHRLQNLEATIHVGDSLIEDTAFTSRPFDWRAAFPQVFARGGFDIVIGNPPYVRMEFIKAIKPYLEKHYAVAADRADLYAYFYERGVEVLRDGGRLGFISSSTFFRTGSGEKLRAFLTSSAAIESVVDFGDLQVFEGVTTYPAILTLEKGGDGAAGELRYLALKDALPDDLGRAFAASAKTMPRARLGGGSWRLEGDALAALRDKIAGGRKTLGEVYGPPLYGIKTGLNEAFIIDTPTRDRLVKADPKSAEILKPFLRGENIKRWRVEPEGLWLVNTPKGKVKIEDYPAIRAWLMPFRKELEKRATKQEWWELQQAQLAYQPKFAGRKISYPHFQNERMFAIEATGAFSNDKSYFIANSDDGLLAYLNSKLAWSFLTSISPAVRDNWHEMRVQYVEELPIPDVLQVGDERLAALGQTCTDAARKRYEIVAAVRHRILDLAPPERRKLNGRLEAWHELDFAGFQAEVKKVFHADVPVKQRGEWETYLRENAARVRELAGRISTAEREIDTIVYALFDLTPEEIALLEASLGSILEYTSKIC